MQERTERHENLLTSVMSDLGSLASLRPSAQGGTIRHLGTPKVSDYLFMLEKEVEGAFERCVLGGFGYVLKGLGKELLNLETHTHPV